MTAGRSSTVSSRRGTGVASAGFDRGGWRRATPVARGTDKRVGDIPESVVDAPLVTDHQFFAERLGDAVVSDASSGAEARLCTSTYSELQLRHAKSNP